MEGPQDLHLPHPCSHTKHACQPRETQERSGDADEVQTAVAVRPGGSGDRIVRRSQMA